MIQMANKRTARMRREGNDELLFLRIWNKADNTPRDEGNSTAGQRQLLLRLHADIHAPKAGLLAFES